ncbi:MAG: hypothetical protein QW555_07845 [Nitrososphaerota archaeon]
MPVKIALDLDGVLSDSMGRWVEIWNTKYGYPTLSVEGLTEWDFWRKLGITQDEFNRIFDEVWQEWPLLKPLEENIDDSVSKIASLGRVDIVSGRVLKHRQYVVSWLKLHEIRYGSLFLGISPKSRLGHDVFIDDSPIEALQIARTRRIVLLRDQPWNRDLGESRYIRRVRSLEEAFEKLRAIILRDTSL